MSEPRLYDFALIKFSDGASPAAMVTLCGITGVQVNETVETQDRRVRDCAKPNKPGVRRIKTTGINWTISGSGRTNADQRAIIKTELLGKHNDYELEYYRDDGTDAGELIGSEKGRAVMTASNMNLDPDAGTSDMEITLEGEGELVYTEAP